MRCKPSWLLWIGWLVCLHTAWALPVYEAQTGEKCASCHILHSELTPRGRKFKLLGYSEGQKVTPFSAIGSVSVTKINSTKSSADPSVSMPYNGEIVPEAVSALITGKFADDLGGKIKWTSNLLNTNPVYGSQGLETGTRVGKDFFLDASELRWSQRDTLANKELIYGVSFNNAPGQQDLWVTTPVNTFPYKTSPLSNAWGMGEFGPTTLIDGGLTSQTMGMSFFGLWDDTWFFDVGNYWKFQSSYSALNIAGPQNTINSSQNPYWRLAWNRVSGPDSWMVGSFGMLTTLARDPLVAGSAAGQYKDIGLDAEYQHITDVHSWSADTVWVHESADWGPHTVGQSHSFATDELTTFKAKLSYDYGRRYSASLFTFKSWGSPDKLYWGYNNNPSSLRGACNQNTSLLAFCSLSSNGKPDTKGFGFQLGYSPTPTIRLVLQQTYYSYFLGGTTFIDNSSGNKRAASDNNLTYIYALFSY